MELNQKMKTAIEQLARSELVKNFEEGGRYGEGKFGGGSKRWKPSQRAIKQKGRTLIDTGRLMGSVGAVFEGNDLILHASNVSYAKTHQEGIEVPARPFLTLPDEFENDVIEIVGRFLEKNELLRWLTQMK